MKKLLAIALSLLLPMTVLAAIPKTILNLENSTGWLRVKMLQITPEEGQKPLEGWATCSAFWIEPNKLMTASHCVTPPENFKITQMWIKRADESAKVVVLHQDPKKDLAVLYTEMVGKPVRLAKTVARGEDSYVLGNPLSIIGVITEGVVAKINHMTKYSGDNKYIILSNIVLPGNSGGLVANKDGECIGVLVMSTSFMGQFGASGLGLAVQLSTIMEFLKDIK